MELHDPEVIHALLVGIGLSAAAGFRVFVPLLGVSLAAHAGYLPLSPEFAWLGTTQAVAALAVATILEVGAYTVPIIDHLMDMITAPAAVIAGTLLMASMLGDTSPFLKWSLAVIAGGGAAGIVQAGSMMLRGGSTVLTGGVGNLLVALLEFAGAIVMTLIAILVPFVAVIGLVVVILLVARALYRRLRVKASAPGNLSP